MGNALASQGWLLNQLVKTDDAIAYAEKGLRLSQKVNDFQGQSIALNTLGTCYNNYLVDFKKAQHYYQLSLTASEFDQNYKTMAMFNLATVEQKLGNYDEAQEFYKKAYSLLKAMQKHLLMVQVACELGLVLLEVGKRTEAETTLLEAIA